MGSGLRVLLLTAGGARHLWLARQLARDFELVGVGIEPKGAEAVPADAAATDPASDLRRHFLEREEVERRLLGATESAPACVLPIPPGSLNSPIVTRWVQSQKPDFLVLFGSGILRTPLLRLFEGRVINLHLGLSPYYRGSGTNFWPFVHKQPECVGATIHLAVSRVDAGAILGQVRPEPEAADRIHETGTKSLMAAARVLPRLIQAYAAGRLTPQAQDVGAGKLFRERDFNVAALRAAWQNLDRGLLAEYLEHRAARCERFPIVPSE